MSKSKLNFSLLALAALVAGFIFSLWPLCLAGLLIAAATGQYAAAVFIGLLLDTLYGAPIGRLHTLYVPFTLLSLLLSALHYYLATYVRRGDQTTL